MNGCIQPFINFITHENVGGSLVSGSFSVIGGILPIAALLWILFHRMKRNFSITLVSEEKILRQYRTSLAELETMKSDLIAHIDAGTVNDDNHEFYQVKSKIDEKVLDYKIEIEKREQFISKIQNANFLTWVSYYFSKAYLSDYFRK